MGAVEFSELGFDDFGNCMDCIVNCIVRVVVGSAIGNIPSKGR